MIQRFIYLLILLLSGLDLNAQKLTVEGMEVTNDISASQYERRDLNGQTCALVKVHLASPGAVFEGNICPPVEYKTGEYWVYMTEGTKELRIKHPHLQPLQVNFMKQGIGGLKARTTYYLSLTFPGGGNNTHRRLSGEIEMISANGVSFNMIRVEGGKFQMGATNGIGKEVDKSEETTHTGILSTYYIGETEVTQELWEAVMGYNPSQFKGGKRPVNNVRWYDCQDFVERLNLITGLKFRLPTEAEWEYAARGGNKSRGFLFSGSNTLDDVAWYKGNAYKGPEYGLHTVKTKLANELGLYDMSGNVLEWCEDLYGYNSGSQTNSLESSQQERRIYRGGACNFIDNECRVSFRGETSPNEHWAILGLRLVLLCEEFESLSVNISTCWMN